MPMIRCEGRGLGNWLVVEKETFAKAQLTNFSTIGWTITLLMKQKERKAVYLTDKGLLHRGL